MGSADLLDNWQSTTAPYSCEGRVEQDTADASYCTGKLQHRDYALVVRWAGCLEV